MYKNKDFSKDLNGIYERLNAIEKWIGDYDPSQNPEEKFNIQEYEFAEEIELLMIAIDKCVKRAEIKAYYTLNNM
ncbi:MAG: hypothetical protein PHU69_12610 [Fermentimonas sp.]|nr:hypothetical protein [Fermentimonas sp.]